MNKLEERSELQFEKLQAILKKYRLQYFREESMLLFLLAGSAGQHKALVKADCLYQTIQTSLKFKQYRRAAWYLIAYIKQCDSLTNTEAITQLRNRLVEKLDIVSEFPIRET